MLPVFGALSLGEFAIPSLVALFSFLASKKFYDNVKDDIPSIFSTEGVVKPLQDNQINDIKVTKPSYVIPSNGVVFKEEEDSKSIVFEDNISVNDLIEVQKDVIEKNDVNVDEISNLFEKVDLEVSSDASNLLEVLKSNNKSLIDALSILNNSIVSNTVSSAVSVKSISVKLDNLLQILTFTNVVLATIANKINFGIFDKLFYLENLRNLENIGNVSVNGEVSLKDIDIVIENLKNLEKLSDLEKLENLDYVGDLAKFKTNEIELKDLEGNYIGKLSPVMIEAIKNAIDAKLGTDENSLTIEDLGLDDYDVDFSDVMNELFKFRGIVSDIQKLKGENGS